MLRDCGWFRLVGWSAFRNSESLAEVVQLFGQFLSHRVHVFHAPSLRLDDGGHKEGEPTVRLKIFLQHDREHGHVSIVGESHLLSTVRGVLESLAHTHHYGGCSLYSRSHVIHERTVH